METLIIFLAMLAAIWFPHVANLITTRVRYWYRSHYGYTSPHAGVNDNG